MSDMEDFSFAEISSEADQVKLAQVTYLLENYVANAAHFVALYGSSPAEDTEEAAEKAKLAQELLNKLGEIAIAGAW